MKPTNKFTIGSNGRIDSTQTRIAPQKEFQHWKTDAQTVALSKHTAVLDRSKFIGPLHKSIFEQIGSEVTQSRLTKETNPTIKSGLQSGTIPNTVFIGESPTGSLGTKKVGNDIQASNGLVMQVRKNSSTIQSSFLSESKGANKGRLQNTIALDTSKGYHFDGTSYK